MSDNDINLIARENGLLDEDSFWSENDVPLQKRGVKIDWIIDFFHKIADYRVQLWKNYHSQCNAAFYFDFNDTWPKPKIPSLSESEECTPEIAVNNYIKPLTMKSKTPIYTRIPLEFRGIPKFFVSHPWGQPLVGQTTMCTLYATSQLLEEFPENDRYVWIDIISYNQHLFESIAHDMKAIIGDIGYLVFPLVAMGLSPSPFNRLWCIWEIMSAYKTKSTIKFF